MKKTLISLATAALFFSIAPLALANITTTPDAPTQPQAQFSFYCNPYTSTFVSGGYYTPISNGNVCTFGLPAQQMSSSSIFLATYKGTPGDATLEANDSGALPNASVMESSPDSFNGVQGDNFFSIAMGFDSFSDVLAENTFLTTGGTDPGNPYSILPWIWGTQPIMQPPTSPLTVSANNQSIELGTAIPALTASLSGFTSAPNDVTGSAACTTTATASSTTGSYPITCTVGTLTSTNYTFGPFIAGSLAIVDTTPPSVSITSPANSTTYLQNASVPVTASVTDLSPITSTTYTLDGMAVNPASPLPLSSVALGTTTFVVAATDSSGNVGYATSTFTVAPVVVDHTPPTIVINNPVQNGLYAKTDSVLVNATVTDNSPIATTTYWFNTTKINPLSPLPLSTASTPSVDSVSVSATDKYGNTATSTVKFFVVKSTNSCLQDIVTVLTLILQDKTLPNKPTIQQLILDCSALLKGQHRGY